MQRNAGTVGNGLRTIAINIANLATKQDEFVNSNGKIRVALKDENGELRSTYDVLNDLSKNWDKLSVAEQNEIAVSLAGKTRYNVLTSVLRNFESAQNSLTTALNSAGSAMEENSRFMESISAKTNILQSQFQQFVLGDGGVESFMKALLDGATVVMKFINSIGGLSTVLKVLGTVIAVVVVRALKSFRNAMTKFIGSIMEGYTLTGSFADALKYVGISANIAKISLESFVAVIGLAITAYSAWKAKQEENLRLLKDTLEAHVENRKEIKETISKLEDENLSREELVSTIQSVIGGYVDETESIDTLNKKRQEAIDLLKEQSQEEANALVRAGLSQHKKDTAFLTKKASGFDININKFSEEQESYLERAGVWNPNKQGAEDLLASLKEAQKEMQAVGLDSAYLNQKIVELSNSITEAKQRQNDWNTALHNSGLWYDENTNTLKEYDKELYEAGKLILEEYAQQNIPEVAKQAMALNDTVKQQEEYLSSLAEELGVTSDELATFIGNLDDDELEEFNEAMSSNDLNVGFELLSKYTNQVEDTTDAIEELTNAIKEATAPLSDAEGAYETINKALEEFTNNGGYSAETIQKLALLGDDWIRVLNDSIATGEISQQTTDDLTEKYRALAIAELQAQASEDMLKIAYGEFNDLSPIAQQALADIGTEMVDIANDTNQATMSVLGLTSAVDQARQIAFGIGGEDAQKKFDAMEKVKNSYAQLIEEMNTWTITGSTSSSKSGKGSSFSSKDAYLEAFKKEKEALKHQLEMDYISEKEYYDSLSELVERYFGVATGLHEKYLDTYQENEEEIYKGLKSIYDEVKDYLAEAVEKSYEDAIKVIEKEEEKVLGTIQKQIDDLKDRKDAHLKSVEKEINALKDQKKTVEDYWDAEIDKIKEANKELEQQNQLLELQKKLAEAKSQKVMVMGEEGTFGLAENEKAVSSAEFNLRKYEDELSYEQQLADMEAMRDAQLQNLQGRIDDLQNYYDYLSEYYENQINALEDYYDKTKEVYEAQKDALQEQLDAFKAGQEEYDNIQNAKLASQVMAMDAEAENWNKELANLRNYINQYNSMLTQLGTAGKYVDYSYSAEDGVIPIPTPIGGGVAKHAKGIASVANDEVALVGDSPNRELVLGANVNKLGTLMALSKGSGVVNAESTDTLAGVLNSLASPTVSGNGSNVTQTFSFGNISLPNVTDANSFVKELSDKFNNYAIQFSSIRE